MSRRRRTTAMVTAALAMVLLGFVVAAAARSLPGRDGEEPWLDLRMRTDIDLSAILAWVILAFAVIGAVMFVLGLREAKPREEPRGRSMIGLLIAIAIFVLAYRFLRPVAQAFFSDGGPGGQEVSGDAAEPTGGAGSAWLFAVLLAAVIAATLTRVGLSIRSVAAPFAPMGEQELRLHTPRHSGMTPRPRVLGDDPRSRILNSYVEFEEGLARVGYPRLQIETEKTHVNRVARELSLDPGHLGRLLRHQLTARFARGVPVEADALEAEESSRRLLESLESEA
ncbi:MAG: hypothetical protein WBZ40_05710 [Acidimicrobiia bacterium]